MNEHCWVVVLLTESSCSIPRKVETTSCWPSHFFFPIFFFEKKSYLKLLFLGMRMFFVEWVEVKLRWVCLKIVYPYTQWLMIIIPTKWLFHWGYTPFSDIPRSTQLALRAHTKPRTQVSSRGRSDVPSYADVMVPRLNIGKRKDLERSWKKVRFGGFDNYQPLLTIIINHQPAINHHTIINLIWRFFWVERIRSEVSIRGWIPRSDPDFSPPRMWTEGSCPTCILE